MKKKILLSVLMLQIVCNFLSAQKISYWKRISEPSDARLQAERIIIPNKYSVFSLDVPFIKAAVATAFKDSYFDADKKGIIAEIPMPDGSLQHFSIVETEVMSTQLAAKFPQIKTYAGLGIEDKYATLRMDITQKGFHGMILSPHGDVFIEPFSLHTTQYYISYYRKDNLHGREDFSCTVIDEWSKEERMKKQSSVNKTIAGSLSTYRLAVAATGEYTRHFGGTVADGMAGITTSVNRITGVYETEVDVRLQLIPNNDLIVYTDANTDPYSNNGGSTLLGQNQTNLDAVIGNSNYDIGHVFTTGNGGVASLGCVCRSASKAKGTSGKSNPEGDGFDIDYAAHEMGHQFNAEHTFNATTGSCGSGNRTPSSAYEPGSGITVMAYAGVCGINNLAPHSIAYFHNRSFTQITNYTTTGFGGNCAVVSTNTNNAPVINSISANYNIPVNTPFTVTGFASDPDADSVTYSWEEFDNGPAGDWNMPSGDAPIFMSNEPSTSGTRLYPSLTNVLNNTNSKGDLKPSYARTLDFRLTVRDNKGGVANNDNLVALTVVNTTFPFEITTGNTAVAIPGGSVQTITWNVASTDAAPINCTAVDITASTDGGNTFPYTIAANTPNTGSYIYTVPNANLSGVRIKITGRGNIFYDINNANLTVAASASIAATAVNKNMFIQRAQLFVYPNPVKDVLYIQLPQGSYKQQLIITDAAGRIVLNKMLEESNSVQQISLPNTIHTGNYFVKAGNENMVKIVVVR